MDDSVDEVNTTYEVDYEDEYLLVAETGEAEGLEPRHLAEAMRTPEWPQWRHAIEEELEALKKAET